MQLSEASSSRRQSTAQQTFYDGSVVITSRLLSINPFEETFVTNVKFGGNLHKFAGLIPGIDQQQQKGLFFSRLVTCTKKCSDIIKENSFATPTKKQKGYATDPNKVKMEDTDSNKFRAANAAPTSETESLFSNTAPPLETKSLFSNLFTLFPKCLKKECHLYCGNKELALESYNPDGKSATPNIKSPVQLLISWVLSV